MAEVAEKGNLQEISFAKIFFSIAGRGKTGVLTIRDPQDNLVQKQIYFLGGDNSFVMYGPIDESLGQILLREGVLDEPALEDILEELAVSEKNIGDIFLTRKILDQASLTKWLERQTEIKLVSCFSLNESLFEFEETTVGKFQFQVKLFTIVPERIVYLGVKKHYNLKRLEAELEYVKEKQLKLNAKYQKDSSKLGLTVEETQLVQEIGAGQTFSHIISRSKLPLADTLKLTYSLLITGMVDIEERKSLQDYKEPPVKIPKRNKTIELEDIEPEQTAKELNIKLEQVPVGEDGNLSATDFSSSTSASVKRKKESPTQPDGQIADDRALVKQRVSDILLTNLKDAIESYVPGRGSGGAKIGELLVRNHVIDSLQLNEAVKKMRDKGGSLLTTLCTMGALQDDDLAQFLSKYYRVPAVNLSEMDLDQEIVSLIPEELSKKYKAIPINRTGRTLVVAMVDPTNLQAIEEIEFLTNYKVEAVVATENMIKNALDKFHDSSSMLDDVMSTFDDSDIDIAETTEEEVNAAELERAGEEAPVVKLVNQIINDAVKRSASDIHFEPYETAFRVRYRIDGVL
jgi:hypothetical protein